MKRFALPGAVLAMLAIAPSAAFGATRVVGTSGPQCKNPTYTTINAASAAAQPGDTIKVCAGTYNETVNVSTPNLTFQGAQAGKDARKDRNNDAKESIVDSQTGGFTLTSAANDVTIDGFTIRNAGVGASNARGILALDGSVGLTVVNDVVEHNSTGVQFQNPASSSTDAAVFRHNRFDGNTTNTNGDADSGIFASNGPANYVDIEENLFENHFDDNPDHNAAAVNNTSPQDANWLVRNNDSIDDDTFFVTIQATNTAVLGNDIVKKNRTASGTGILIGGDNNGVLVQDNKIKDGAANGITVRNVFGGPDSNVFIRHNDVDKRLNGIRVAGDETGVDVEDNHVTNSTNDGFLIEQSMTGPSPMATFLKNNQAQSSGNFDCEDQTTGTGTAGTASTWQNDKGKSDSPTGICKK